MSEQRGEQKGRCKFLIKALGLSHLPYKPVSMSESIDQDLKIDVKRKKCNFLFI